MRSAEKVRDSTLDDEKYDVHYSERRPVGKYMTDGTQQSVVVMALCKRSFHFRPW